MKMISYKKMPPLKCSYFLFLRTNLTVLLVMMKLAKSRIIFIYINNKRTKLFSFTSKHPHQRAQHGMYATPWLFGLFGG